MGKYVMSEMNQASAEINNWASEDIDTLNDKIKSLNNMINDKSNSGELLKSIKEYASYDVSGINSLIKGFEAFDTNFRNATSDYNGKVGQDVDTEELIRKIDGNKQLIDNYKNQLANLPKDDIATPIFTLALNGCIGALEGIQSSYSNLIEKFNHWNGEHSNALDGTHDVIRKAYNVLKQLEKIPFDSKSGYDLTRVDLKGLILLEDESWNEFLVAKGYVNKDGAIQSKGFKYIEKICKKDYDSVTEKEFALATRLMLYADTSEEVEELLNAGYCEYKEYTIMDVRGFPTKETRREASKCFEDLVTTALATDLINVRYGEENLDSERWTQASENIACLAAMNQFLNENKYIHVSGVNVVEKPGSEKMTDTLYSINGGAVSLDYMNCGLGRDAESNIEDYEKLQEDIEEDLKNVKNAWLVVSTIVSLIPGSGALVSTLKETFSYMGLAKNSASSASVITEAFKTLTGDENSSINERLTLAIDVSDEGRQYHQNFALNIVRYGDQLLGFPSKETKGALNHFNSQMKALENGIQCDPGDEARFDDAFKNAGFAVAGDEEYKKRIDVSVLKSTKTVLKDIGFNEVEPEKVFDVEKVVDKSTGKITYTLNKGTIKEISTEDLYNTDKEKIIKKYSILYNKLYNKGEY